MLLQTFIWGTLLGLCSAGHRPFVEREGNRYSRNNDRWIQRIHHSSIQDQGTQRVQYPSIQDQGTQRVQYPSIQDQGTQRVQYPSKQDQGTQRVQYPSIQDQGTQRVQYPSVFDRGQTVQYPSLGDQDASSQIQKCAPGYYRESSGASSGRCVPCSCNGLASQCDQRTGKCLNCQYNTAGDRCERCKEGYYGDAAKRSCRICPCPYKFPSNSFAVGCSEVVGGVRCDCRTGYAGQRCEQCAPGYYGEPMEAGGSCRPCECRGNRNSCDSRTGVCKNSLEPGDTDTNEPCQECDSCAQTLLNDLEHLDEELQRIKTLLDNANFSTSSLNQLRELEMAIAETKILVSKFNSTISSQEMDVSQLELDTSTLEKDINALNKKANDREIAAVKLVEDVNKTHKRAEDLDDEAKNLLKRILDLIAKLNQSGDGVVPSENLAKILAEAEHMVKEMQKRNFNPQKDAAEEEKDEAQKLLDYIKTNVTNQYEKNYAAANRTKGLLNDYEAKLKDLEEALKQAEELVKKANTQNGLNEKELKDILKRVEDLEKERNKVKEQIAKAKDQLKETEGLLRMLKDSKTEYEQLAAQLDGARINLTVKVNTLSQASAKEDLVKRAEEHAKMLSELAMELEDAVKNASNRSDVRNAMKVIDAYKNIIDAVNEAEKAANEAKDAADKALTDVEKEDLKKKAQNLKDHANDLLADAKVAEDDLRRASDDLKAQRKRLKDAERKKKALAKDLLDAQTELGNINRDDISDMLAEAKSKAASANDTSAATIARLNEIKKEVAKINVTGSDSNLTVNMDDVDNLVKKLLNTIPNLEDKINEVEDLSTQLPIANISENINRIKELIEQARDAANRVVVPMKFNGASHVELRTPRDMDDLKAYTALSMSLSLSPKTSRGDGTRRRRQSTDDGNMFVLYLGNRNSPKDFIGMYLSKDVLNCVYTLGGEEKTITTQSITRSPSETALFDKVDLHRIYENAEVIFTKMFTSTLPEQPVKTTSQGNVKKNLLNLDPSDMVFYVGGYPSNFVPPDSLKYSNYTGCIELSIFNDRFISLYNFKNAVNVNPEPPCKRYAPSETLEFFEGTGYAKVSLKDILGPTLAFKQVITTRSGNGVLFYTGNDLKYYSVTIEKRKVVINSNSFKSPVQSTNQVIPLGMESEDILIILSGRKEIIVRFGTREVAKVTDIDYSFGDFVEYYIGGVPQALRDRYNITTQPLKGCVKNIKINDKFAPIVEKVGVSRGCPMDFLASRKAELNIGSSLSANITGFSQPGDVKVSLGFKSSEKEGLLLKNTQLNTAAIDLSLVDGYVVLSFKGANPKSWKSSKQYQDGKWHYLTALWIEASQSINLQIDGKDEGEVFAFRDFDLSQRSMTLGKDNFKGCLSNLFLRRTESLYRADDLSMLASDGDVLLDVCNGDKSPQLMLDRSTTRMDGGTMGSDESLSVCANPALVKRAYHIGGPVSSMSYRVSPKALQPKPIFSLDVRTKSSKGLLFYAATRRGSSHMALYMSKGRIRLSVGKMKEIFHREKYNDGKWHSVVFSLENKKFRLVVDGIRAQDGQFTNNKAVSMELTSPLYLGSAPDSLKTELKSKLLPTHSVIGCVRNFKVNGTHMPEPTTNRGAGPCFNGSPQLGAYFSGRGAHVIINDSFVVGTTFEAVFDIRPRSLNGVLLHVGNSGRPGHGHNARHHLSLYMRRGEVVAWVNNGDGDFSVAVTPRQPLCDGMFHRVAVVKRNNVVEMHVDNEGDHKIGPTSSSSTLTKDPLYVGGIAETSMHPSLPVTESFKGCIQNMKINEEAISFEKLSSVFGPVNLRECPAG